MIHEDFLNRMKLMLKDEYEEFCGCLDKDEYKALRINTLKGSDDKFKEQNYFDITQVSWCKLGYYYDGNKDRPGKHPLHEAGVYYIQEPSAMLPAVLMAAKPGERILDLCAAPGGKSTQMAVDMKDKGFIICNEINNGRAKILSENIERLGIGNAIVTNETPARLKEIFMDYFDGIMVDAPCSGEGMFRKNEEAGNEWSSQNVIMCGERQDEILDCAASMLRPGGRIVYSTCTFAPIENEGTIARFLTRNPEFKLVNVYENNQELKNVKGILDTGKEEFLKEFCECKVKIMCDDGEEELEIGDSVAKEMEKTIRLWPHKINGEGHFAALLIKTAGEDNESGINEKDYMGKGQCLDEKEDNLHMEIRGKCRLGNQVGLKEKECKEYIEFRDEYIKKKLDGNLVKYGEQLYLMPDGAPAIKGLKVLRPGLHLGTMKKNRFEPAHALALYLKSEDVKYSKQIYLVDEYSDGNENTENKKMATAKEYISGQTFECEGEKGWYLITVNDYSIGWGKLAAGIMKNHYPRGLRKSYG